MEKEVVELLTNLIQFIPIEWDRYTGKSGEYNVYGWIKRKDGQRDFVVIQTWFKDEKLNAGYVTSSAKHSKEICMLLYGTTKEHESCKRIDHILINKLYQ